MRTLRIANGGPERAKKTEFGGERGEIVQTQNRQLIRDASAEYVVLLGRITRSARANISAS